jgi:Mn-dependent DtxR family transcriptional regulator
MTQVWKEFEGNEVTHSMAHYLMAIQDLLKAQGYARVTDVARELDITPGSASVSIRTLKAKGYVSEDRNRFLNLTPDGERIAHDVHLTHRSFTYLFQHILGVPEEQANIDSCKIEHLVSTPTRERLLAFLRYATDEKNRAAKAFREGFKSYDAHCPGHDHCNLCEGDRCELECIHHDAAKGSA